MAEENNYLHEIATTAIIVNKEGKYLITRRAPERKRYPGYWTVPGGRIQTSDYLALPKETEFYWYNVLERTLKREVMEESGVEITNVEYLTSLATVHKDGTPSLVISCVADYVNGQVKIQPGESDDFAWVSIEEAKAYQLMDGIYEELVMVNKKRAGEKNVLWEKDLK
ncbi:MAG: NUDIX domain-containing protein [Candidatus Vogelbacteria bacterium]|nr:NUDIX domain-containing protein [Candidatus Vogelbacteria bacterium]